MTDLKRYEVGVVYSFDAEDEAHACEQFIDAEPECGPHMNYVKVLLERVADMKYGITWSTEGGGSFHQTGFKYETIDDAVVAAAASDWSDPRGIMPGRLPKAGEVVWAAIERDDYGDPVIRMQATNPMKPFDVTVTFRIDADSPGHAEEVFEDTYWNEPERLEYNVRSLRIFDVEPTNIQN